MTLTRSLGGVLAKLRQPISPAAYRRITMVALVLLVAIVITGAGVRLTGSGLGCTDWPQCTDTTFTPTSDLHAQIEFWNRMITGLVSAAVAAAVLGSLRSLVVARAPLRDGMVVYVLFVGLLESGPMGPSVNLLTFLWIWATASGLRASAGAR